MNTEIVVSFGPISFIAIVSQQIFIIYAIYAIFVRPMFNRSNREKLLQNSPDFDQTCPGFHDACGGV